MDIHYTLYRTWRRLLYRAKQPWFFWQRGRRGWSDDDLWDLGAYLYRILATSLPVLAKIATSHPCGFPEEAPAKCGKCPCWDLWQKELTHGASLFQKLVDGGFDTNEEEEQGYKNAMGWLDEWIGHLWI